MKKCLFVLALLLSATSAFAQIATEEEMISFCRKQLYDADKRACIGIVQNNLFEINAVNLCSRQLYDADKRACLSIIANREFSQAMLNFCSAQLYDIDKRSCLQTASSTPIDNQPPAPRCDLRRLSRQVDGAIGHFNSYNREALGNTLYNMRELLDRCLPNGG